MTTSNRRNESHGWHCRNQTNLAAGPVGIIFAITTVGNIDPQPLSTITRPSGSFFAFGTIT